MKRGYLGISIALIAVMGIGGLMVASGKIRKPEWGICFGECERDRRIVFGLMVWGKLEALAKCGRIPEQHAAFDELFPDLVLSMAERSERQAYLIDRRNSGEITLDERDELYRSINDPGTSVRGASSSCGSGGFGRDHNGNPDLNLFCRDLAVMDFGHNSSPSYRYSGAAYVSQTDLAYERMRGSGTLAAYIGRTREELRAYEASEDLARAAVRKLPAGDFAPRVDATEEQLIERKVVELTCEGWNTVP